jgi:lipopolysaccharide transport system ATP-binding protein
MPPPALRLENVSKMYRLGEVGTGTLSNDLARTWARVRGKKDPFEKIGTVNDRTASGTQDYVWALRDIDFEVQQGQIIGIIGRNGAGKSTLLKILSRVTSPTKGRILINGRIASLLEVGTGFHPELTGRENVFLNGAILGMTKTEVRSRFFVIVDFSGCAKYIDTPVKRYSSGMHVRLAFAVAAHLETDILIVDEVLAVGDAEFQAKCIGKMRDISSTGQRTVLFVSHNMTSVRQLCPLAILMDQGTIVASGETVDIVEKYMTQGRQGDRSITWSQINAPKGKGVRLRGIHVKDEQGRTEGALESGKEFIVEIDYELTAELRGLRVGISLINAEGILIFVSSDFHCVETKLRGSAGRYVSRATLPANLLIAGSYDLEVHFEIPRVEELLRGVLCRFEISEQTHQLWGPMRNPRLPGVVHPVVRWTIETEKSA